MTLLLQVSAYTGHLQRGGYQWKGELWLIMSETCRVTSRIHVLNKLHCKMFVTWNGLGVS
jgi:hypothetical protein